MGANVTIEGTTAIVQGVDTLKPALLEAKDLRGGAALIEAAMLAEGKSAIQGIQYVERGYENIVEKLRQVGVNIQKES